MVLFRNIILIKRAIRALILLTLIIIIGLYAIYAHFIAAPKDFSEPTIFTIESGATLSDVVHNLKEQNIIQSTEFTKDILIGFHKEHIIAGDYFFKKSLTSFQVAKRIAKGEYGLMPIRVTFPEGLNIKQMADILSQRLGQTFSAASFIKDAAPKEGYLFPDTYFFMPNAKPDDVIGMMSKTFDKKITTIQEGIDSFGHSISDDVIMASIVEKEALGYKDKQMVAGILWNRIELGMPLQVDAAFLKVPETEGRNTYQLTHADLKVDSPYNTYVNKGLPPTPITNPGLDSLKAAINPIESDYLYYLTGNDGKMYYATTFDKHKQNKKNYL